MPGPITSRCRHIPGRARRSAARARRDGTRQRDAVLPAGAELSPLRTSVSPRAGLRGSPPSPAPLGPSVALALFAGPVPSSRDSAGDSDRDSNRDRDRIDVPVTLLAHHSLSALPGRATRSQILFSLLQNKTSGGLLWVGWVFFFFPFPPCLFFFNINRSGQLGKRKRERA